VVPIDKVKDYRVCFYEENGILMRQWNPLERERKEDRFLQTQGTVNQIVMPRGERCQILEIAHDKAGHLGIEKNQR